MPNDAATALLAQAASGIHRAARYHKRESQRHRRLARELAQEYDRLRAQCSQLGIAIEVIDTDQEGHRP
jgi:hypothetical protein